jgi:hypothetical protein
MTMLSVPFSNAVTSMSAKFAQMGIDPNTAIGMAQGKLYGQLVQQSTLCAFMNAYRTYAILILVLIPLVFVLKQFMPEQEQT